MAYLIDFLITASVITGVLASVATIAFSVSITRTRILWFILLTTALYTLTFALKQDTTAMLVSAVTVLRSIVFLVGFKWDFWWAKPAKVKWVLMALAVAAWYFTTDFSSATWVSYFMLVLPIVVVVAMSLQSIKGNKWLMLVSGVGWTTYEILTGAYGLIPGEIFGIIATIVALLRLYRVPEAEIAVPNPKPILL